MIIGKVVGTVICTRKNSSLVGSKFLIVDPMEKMEIDGCDRIVAVDDVGAGIGELVLGYGQCGKTWLRRSEFPGGCMYCWYR